MADPFVAEIRAFGFNFNPRGWFLCNGQLLSIAQYSTLFSLLGTNYGGNGQNNFGLPNMQGLSLMSQGNGTGLTPRSIGEIGGTTNVTLITTQMPQHSHAPDAKTESGAADMHNAPAAGDYLTRFTPNPGVGLAYSPAPNSQPVTMNPQMIGLAGGSQPHSNQQPYLVMNYCIANDGIYPTRN